jgi:hypothetical protein
MSVPAPFWPTSFTSQHSLASLRVPVAEKAIVRPAVRLYSTDRAGNSSIATLLAAKPA